MIFGNLFRVVRSRFGVIMLVLGVTLAATAAVSLLMPKQYQATTSMVVDMPSNDPVLGSAVYLQGSIASFLATQVELIRSERVIKRVIADQKLTDDPFLKAQWADQTGGKVPMAAWLGGTMTKNVSIETSREGAVMTLNFVAGDPGVAARIANGFAQAYIGVSLELKVEPARNYAQQFETQVQQYRRELVEAQQKLSQFQQQSGILATDERLDVENSRLQELSSQLVQIQALSVESRSRESAMQRSGREAMPELVSNPTLNGLKADISRTEGRLHELSARLGSAHPQILSTQAELDALKARYETESARVASSIGASAGINDQREVQIRAALEAQRARVMQIKKQRDQAAILQRDVDNAQRGLDLLTQRLTQTTMESRSRQSNVSVVTEAYPPSKPSQPQPILNMAIGLLVGLALGVLAALTLEMVQRPVRDTEDLLSAAGVPVLAVLPPAGSRRAQRLIGSTGPTMGGGGGVLRLDKQ